MLVFFLLQVDIALKNDDLSCRRRISDLLYTLTSAGLFFQQWTLISLPLSCTILWKWHFMICDFLLSLMKLTSISLSVKQRQWLCLIIFLFCFFPFFKVKIPLMKGVIWESNFLPLKHFQYNWILGKKYHNDYLQLLQNRISFTSTMNTWNVGDSKYVFLHSVPQRKLQ